MSGSLTQLAAIGSQDAYLSGTGADDANTVTFFRCVFRKHTNFAREAIELTARSTANFGREVSFEVARNGDLVTKMYVQMDLPALSTSNLTHTEVAWTNPIGYAAIEYAEVDIGGQKFDRHYGEYLHCWNELTEDKHKSNAKMIGKYDTWAEQVTASSQKQRLYIPLDFWFNRNLCMALPMVALQFHSVTIKIKFRNWTDLVRAKNTVSGNGEYSAVQLTNSLTTGAAAVNTTPSMVECKLLCDYIFLDSAERRLFASAESHSYLVETVQHTGAEALAGDQPSHNVTLSLNHPCKGLMWVMRANEHTEHNDWLNFKGIDPLWADNGLSASGAVHDLPGSNGHEAFSTAGLKFNGHDRFKARDNSFFRIVQAQQHYANIPEDKIYTYNFALSPMEWLPSGSANFSRIDTVTMNFTYSSASKKKWLGNGLQDASTSSGKSQSSDLLLFAKSYNVVKIISGMAGIRFSN